ncbi:MAG: amidophosphoribosyltransferase [Firmicutes bacterium]|nr:amidophosphoribosyltransferase [Bacillota bacterium]
MAPLEDGPREKCGVFGIWGLPGAAAVTYRGLTALQHRGQESAGITVLRDGRLSTLKGMGLLSHVFSSWNPEELLGESAIGHVRYSTTGRSEPQNAQPLVFRLPAGPLALAHNGNIVNAARLRRRLEDQGAIFQTGTDTEIVAHLMARSKAPSARVALEEALAEVQGAYALLLLTPHALLAARDPHGIRPLQLGVLEGRPVLASESCAFDAVGAQTVRDVAPGEVLEIGAGGVTSGGARGAREAFCLFEYIYFARPDSVVDGRSVYAVRKELGRRLAKAAPVEADVVVGAPEASIPAALGYAEASGLPFELGLIKNRYLGRTFIQPSQALREEAVRLKLNPVRDVVAGRRVVLVDDSIVRGTTAMQLVRMLREAGATEVHLRVTAPPYRHPCFYGIDTSVAEELVARGGVEEVLRAVGADSLAYLPLEEVAEATGHAGRLCDACFTGRYPIPVAGGTGKFELEAQP